MLDDKLEKARQESAKKKEQLLIGVVAALLLTVVVYFCYLGVTSFFENRESANQPIAETKSSEPLPSVETENTEEELAKLRDLFKELLAHFEAEVEPLLPSGSGWKEEELFEIGQLKKSSLSFFSNGDYEQALATLEKTKKISEKVINDSVATFEAELVSARGYLEKDQYDEAKFHIDKALIIKPQDEKALALKEEIEKLPQILSLLGEVTVAQTENNLLKEYELLGAVLQIVPDRAGIKERRAELEDLIKEQAFALHIDAGFEAVEAGKAQAARNNYNEAKKIDPSRYELKTLASQLASLERRIRVQSAIANAEQAVRRDDWQSAYNYYVKASKDAPQNTTVQEGVNRSKQIVDIRKELDRYLADPYRLSDSNIADKAKELIKRAEPIGKFSFSLQQQSRALQTNLELMNQQVAVTVISDKKTYVRVRGVGNVGEIQQKTIQLKPGRYTFEGSRKGYTTKFVKTLIPYDKQEFQVTVICDQPI